jgi:hypothetical protein
MKDKVLETCCHDDESCAHDHCGQHGQAWQELICHFPYAVYAVAFSFIILSILSFFDGGAGAASGSTMPHECSHDHGYHLLFHSFHFLHLVFAVTGTLIMFLKYSNAVIRGVIISIFSAVVFCTMSDIALPYLAGSLLGISMHIHICFITELINVVPFLLVGVINGLCLSRHHKDFLQNVSLSSHFVHIFLSSLAALFYSVSYGLTEWHESMGILFFFLILAVVVPCTLSDVVVPVYCARFLPKKRNN